VLRPDRDGEPAAGARIVADGAVRLQVCPATGLSGAPPGWESPSRSL